MKFTPSRIARAAAVAAMYVLLTFVFQTFSFGAIQFRVSEALMLLPVAADFAVPGLFIGCLIANLICGGVWYDIVIGSIATLIAAILVRRLRAKTWVAAAMPAIVNGIMVGPVVYFAYVSGTGFGVLISTIATVALGEIAVCYALGVPMLHLLKRLPAQVFE